MKKVYVDVDAKWLKEGLIVPVAIYWQMGQDESVVELCVIDRIISGPDRRTSHVGGVGKRYVIEISGQRRNLFLEKDRWFLEVNR